MIESTTELNFTKYDAMQTERRINSWSERLFQAMDRMIHKDEMEYLERDDLTFKQRYSIVEKLGRLNDVSGYHGVFVKHIVKLIESLPPKENGAPFRILDIGAGSGRLLKALYKKTLKKGISVELCGVDSAADFAIVTETNLKSQGIPITMYHADGADLSHVEDYSFDIVTSSYMVHHIRTPESVSRFLSEVQRISRGGWIIADIDRRLYAPTLIGVLGFLMSGNWNLVSDGIKSAQRAYRTREVNFIIQESSKIGRISSMQCASYPFFPYWFIEGCKANAA